MERHGSLLAIGVLAVLASGCARPVAIDDGRVLREVADHYRFFYPEAGDTDAAHDAGLLRPRFGLPAIVKAGASFELELMERGAGSGAPLKAAIVSPLVSDAEAARCVESQAAVEGCHPLSLARTQREMIEPGVTLSRLSASAAAPPGGYDLFLLTGVDAPIRAPRAVWLRAEDPDAIKMLRIVHMSDLHIGKRPEDELEAHLRDVITEVNALSPDAIVITGDIVNWGEQASLPPRARALLLAMRSPAFIIVGNHDLGFGADPIFGKSYLRGWSNFARSFHPFLHYRATLGGYDFIGFDSGPSVPSPEILTRGILPETLASLRAEVDAAYRAKRRGVILFSHAPTRAGLAADPGSTAVGHFGRMHEGGEELERLMLDAAARGQRVIHLAGHTHWSDCFEAGAGPSGACFVRSSLASLPPCPTPIPSRAVMITTQAADHSGIPFKENARGWGFTVIDLDGDEARVAFHRDGLGRAPRCDEPRTARK